MFAWHRTCDEKIPLTLDDLLKWVLLVAQTPPALVVREVLLWNLEGGLQGWHCYSTWSHRRREHRGWLTSLWQRFSLVCWLILLFLLVNPLPEVSLWSSAHHCLVEVLRHWIVCKPTPARAGIISVMFYQSHLFLFTCRIVCWFLFWDILVLWDIVQYLKELGVAEKSQNPFHRFSQVCSREADRNCWMALSIVIIVKHNQIQTSQQAKRQRPSLLFTS